MAVRIAGVTIPNDKKVAFSLAYIYGVGLSQAKKILVNAKVDENKRVHELKDDEINRIREIIEKNYTVEGDLRREIGSNIKRLKEIGSYRGTRHSRNLPTRGQRTKTNSRTVRGNKRVTMGSGKTKVTQK
ncbi:MAG: 30S ribosomal protein S13 [Planctomycetes bacterium]|jgi:small subunit ribosomal protein S13|nr:30S ribosomal protein S13 [Planctomycetota bacterium]